MKTLNDPIIKLFILKNGKTKQWGVEKLCHNWDWRIDLYFWSWTIWLEEVEREETNNPA
jgi:hypothetical protein